MRWLLSRECGWLLVGFSICSMAYSISLGWWGWAFALLLNAVFIWSTMPMVERRNK